MNRLRPQNPKNKNMVDENKNMIDEKKSISVVEKYVLLISVQQV